MVRIWGFDLSEMHWGAFGSKKMLDSRWYLRKERIIIYKIAMLTGLAAECCATYSLAKYNSQEANVERVSGNVAEVHNNDIYAASCITILFCVLVATLFGADFFFLLFWPRRRYPRWYNRSKKGLAVMISIGMAAATIMSTVVVGFHEAYVVGPSPAEIDRLIELYSRPPMVYRRWPTNIAWVVLLWIAFFSTVASTVVMFLAVAHDTTHGTAPYPRGPDGAINEKGDNQATHVLNPGLAGGIQAPEAAHGKARTSLGSSVETGSARGGWNSTTGRFNERDLV
ncbi:hypothetical protein FA15DRAFT_759462 [Coprinopsis marcescibilis]|jgi:hypothetical protein|uniref:Uncharacterized protein n=1 Tax=Coprinopsis marcescibilis TaxID=230819 RepID=A0A5C3KJH2_COPMA|nr:hypothetical protein FA15DRAFT_759462 [Coprinopsis marcescibilis]